jgi:hypothetical protein
LVEEILAEAKGVEGVVPKGLVFCDNVLLNELSVIVFSVLIEFIGPA